MFARFGHLKILHKMLEGDLDAHPDRLQSTEGNLGKEKARMQPKKYSVGGAPRDTWYGYEKNALKIK